MNVTGNPQFVLAYKLKSLKRNLKLWNKSVFGQLKAIIAAAEERVLSHQNAYDLSPSDQLLVDLNSAKTSLHNWLKAEATHWKQKSRVKWLHHGDRNIHFFHLSAKSRGNFNRIDKITVDGSLLDYQALIREKRCRILFLSFQGPPGCY